jgi:hypothetical protein
MVGLFQLVYCLEVGIQIKSTRAGEYVDTTRVCLEVSITAYSIHMRRHVSEDMN